MMPLGDNFAIGEKALDIKPGDRPSPISTLHLQRSPYPGAGMSWVKQQIADGADSGEEMQFE